MKMPWKETTVGDVLRLEYGRPLKETHRQSTGRFPVYGANGEIARSDRHYYDKPSIIVGRKGSAGQLKLTERAFWPLDVTYFVTFDEAKYDLGFLYHLLSTLDLPGLAKGVKPGINRNEVYAKRANVPPFPEQRRIVGILEEAFEGIAKAKANAEKNLQNARALFETHLETVLSQRGPGWVEKPLREVCAIRSTLVDPRGNALLDLIHVGAGNIESKTGVLSDLKTAREEGLVSGKFLFSDAVVLYSKIRPYLMKVARPTFSGLCSADVYPLEPLPTRTTRDYLFYLLLSRKFTDYAIQGSARAGMPKVNRDHLFDFKAWIPDVATQTRLAAGFDELSKEMRRLESIYHKKAAALEELKKSLLHSAFAGKL